MQPPLSLVEVERHGDVFCARLGEPRLDEATVARLTAELFSLIDDQGCRKLVLDLGPRPIQCLYSMFIARLVQVRRRLLDEGGAMRICRGSAETTQVFEAVGLQDFFDFSPDRAAAVAALGAEPADGS